MCGEDSVIRDVMLPVGECGSGSVVVWISVSVVAAVGWRTEADSCWRLTAASVQLTEHRLHLHHTHARLHMHF